MGVWFLFSCNCGYAARVSGMPDMGFIAESVTMECLDCKETHDVVTYYFDEENDDGNTGKYPECEGDNLVPWGQIDSHKEANERMSYLDDNQDTFDDYRYTVNQKEEINV